MSVDWQTASDRLNRFRTLDSDLQYDLARLCKAQSRDDKLAFKLEEGRTYPAASNLHIYIYICRCIYICIIII